MAAVISWIAELIYAVERLRLWPVPLVGHSSGSATHIELRVCDGTKRISTSCLRGLRHCEGLGLFQPHAAREAQDFLFARIAALRFGDSMAVADDDQAMADGLQLLDVRGDEDNADARAGELDQYSIDLPFGGDVDAAGWRIADQQTRRAEQRATEQ